MNKADIVFNAPCSNCGCVGIHACTGPIIDRANTSDDLCFSFLPGMSREEVMARLTAAQAKVIAAAPRLMSDEFLFYGDEIHGPRRPDACN